MPPDPGSPVKTKDFMRAHRSELLLGAGGLVVAIALYLRSRNSANQAASTPASTTTLPVEYTGGAGNGAGGDYFGELEQQINALGQQVSQLNQNGPQGPPGPPGPAAPAAPASGVFNYQDFSQGVSFSQLEGGAGAGFTPLGYYRGPGGTDFTGADVGQSGAPVYAGIFGGLYQGFNPANLPIGTELFTVEQAKPYIQGAPALGPGASNYENLGIPA